MSSSQKYRIHLTLTIHSPLESYFIGSQPAVTWEWLGMAIVILPLRAGFEPTYFRVTVYSVNQYAYFFSKLGPKGDVSYTFTSFCLRISPFIGTTCGTHGTRLRLRVVVGILAPCPDVTFRVHSVVSRHLCSALHTLRLDAESARRCSRDLASGVMVRALIMLTRASLRQSISTTQSMENPITLVGARAYLRDAG